MRPQKNTFVSSRFLHLRMPIGMERSAKTRWRQPWRCWIPRSLQRLSRQPRNFGMGWGWEVSDGKWQRNRQIRFIVLDGMIGIVLVVVSGMRNIQNGKKTMTRQTADMIIIYYYDSSMEMWLLKGLEILMSRGGQLHPIGGLLLLMRLIIICLHLSKNMCLHLFHNVILSGIIPPPSALWDMVFPHRNGRCMRTAAVEKSRIA